MNDFSIPTYAIEVYYPEGWIEIVQKVGRFAAEMEMSRRKQAGDEYVRLINLDEMTLAA